ncbi:hypothetical protein HK405_004567 [Cladochytrium tenue]|nr:hypothetical protein HK405_004567 [Cladochytrium tenue]
MVTSVTNPVDLDVLHLDIDLDAIGPAAGILSPTAPPPIFTPARLAHDLDEVERLAALLTDLGAGAPDANARMALTRLTSLANTRDFLPAASRMFQYAHRVLQERAENCAGGACRSASTAISGLRRCGLLQKDDLIALPKTGEACGGRYIVPSFYLSLIDSTRDKLQRRISRLQRSIRQKEKGLERQLARSQRKERRSLLEFSDVSTLTSKTDVSGTNEPLAVADADKSAAAAAVFATPTPSVEDLHLLKGGELCIKSEDCSPVFILDRHPKQSSSQDAYRVSVPTHPHQVPLIGQGRFSYGPTSTPASDSISASGFFPQEHQVSGEQCCKLDTAELARMGLAPRAAAAQQQLLSKVTVATSAAATATRDKPGQRQHSAAARSKCIYPFVRPEAPTTSLAAEAAYSTATTATASHLNQQSLPTTSRPTVDADAAPSIAVPCDRRPGVGTSAPTSLVTSAPMVSSQQPVHDTLLGARRPSVSDLPTVTSAHPHSSSILHHGPQSLPHAGHRGHYPPGTFTAHARHFQAPSSRQYRPTAPRAAAALFAVGSTTSKTAHSSFVPPRPVPSSPRYPNARGPAQGVPPPVREQAAFSNSAHHGTTGSMPYYNRAPTYYGATASVSQWPLASPRLSTGTPTTTQQRFPRPTAAPRPGAVHHRNPACSAMPSVAAAVQAAAAAAVVNASAAAAAAAATTTCVPSAYPLPAPPTRKRRAVLVDEGGVVAASVASAAAAAEASYVVDHQHLHHPIPRHPATSAAAFMPCTTPKRSRFDPSHQQPAAQVPIPAQVPVPAQQPRFAPAAAAASGYSGGATGPHPPPTCSSGGALGPPLSPALAAAASAGSQCCVTSPQQQGTAFLGD